MVYLKWEACLVRGYMGYRDYNACREERERERNRDYNGPGICATGRCRVGVLACVRTTTVAKAVSPLSSSLLALLFLSLFLPVYLRIVHATHARVYKLVVRSRMLAPG